MFKEVKEGAKIYFSQPNGSASISKFKNGKRYFISKVNSKFNNETHLKIRNGEPFSILRIFQPQKIGELATLCLKRDIDNTLCYIRSKDMSYFSVTGD